MTHSHSWILKFQTLILKQFRSSFKITEKTREISKFGNGSLYLEKNPQREKLVKTYSISKFEMLIIINKIIFLLLLIGTLNDCHRIDLLLRYSGLMARWQNVDPILWLGPVYSDCPIFFILKFWLILVICVWIIKYFEVHI